MKEIITSRQNPRVKEVCGLTEKKKRRETGLFRLDGIKLFCEAIASGVEIETVFLREPASATVEAAVRRAMAEGGLSEERIVWVSDSVFEKISEEKTPEGVLCVAKQPEHLHRRGNAQELIGEIRAEERLLLAESLRDTGNLGTILRSCAALGVDRLILSDDCADLYHSESQIQYKLFSSFMNSS